MCDCNHHTGGKAPETFPTGRSTARWGARIWGTLHDRLNASSNYDAAAAPGPPTPREGGWAFRWLCCRYVRPSAPLMFPGTIEQTGRKCYRSCPTRARRPVGATSTQAGLVLERIVSIHPFPPGRRRLDFRGTSPFIFPVSVSRAPWSLPFAPIWQLSRDSPMPRRRSTTRASTRRRISRSTCAPPTISMPASCARPRS